MKFKHQFTLLAGLFISVSVHAITHEPDSVFDTPPPEVSYSANPTSQDDQRLLSLYDNRHLPPTNIVGTGRLDDSVITISSGWANDIRTDQPLYTRVRYLGTPLLMDTHTKLKSIRLMSSKDEHVYFDSIVG